MADTNPIIRPSNAVMLFALGAADPTAADAFPFEEGFTYNAPFTNEQSTEVTGDLVASAPIIVGQQANISVSVRLKGAGAGTVYGPGVTPPHHALLEAAGMRGLFTPAVASEALAAGSTTSATLGASFSAVAQAYRGMPLALTGPNSEGRTVHIADYTAAKVATLTDEMAAALSVSESASIPANWTYAGTSPKTLAARATDHPVGVLWIYEDGTLRKYTDCRITLNMNGPTARAGLVNFTITGIFAEKIDAAIPAVTLPLHTAPVFATGRGGVDPSLLVDRKPLGVSQWALNNNTTSDPVEDPSTPDGFGASELDRRRPMLEIDPHATLIANRDTISEIENSTEYNAVVRLGRVAGNRLSIVFPKLTPANTAPGTRGIKRTENLQLRALNNGLDASGRDSDAIICFS